MGPLADFNLGQLLIDFLRLYGRDFNYFVTGISVRNDGHYFHKFDKGWLDMNRPYLLAVEDPQDEENDVGKNSFKILIVRRAFEYGFTRLYRHPINLEHQYTPTPLSRVLLNDPKLVIYREFVSQLHPVKEQKWTTKSRTKPRNGNGHSRPQEWRVAQKDVQQPPTKPQQVQPRTERAPPVQTTEPEAQEHKPLAILVNVPTSGQTQRQVYYPQQTSTTATPPIPVVDIDASTAEQPPKNQTRTGTGRYAHHHPDPASDPQLRGKTSEKPKPYKRGRGFRKRKQRD